MKKGRIIITQELLKKMFELPEEAYIANIYRNTYNCMETDCYEILVIHYGKECPEGAIPEIIGINEKIE